MTVRNRFSTQIDADIDRRLRATLLAMRRRGIPITLAEATTDALRTWCAATAEALTDGNDFEQPDGPTRFPPGRPLEDFPRTNPASEST